METKNQNNLYFIHANGFLPGAYKSLFKDFNNSITINNYFLLDLFKKEPNIKLKNWIPFHDDFIKSIKTKNNIGMGHSIGGNIILRSSISSPKLFKAIILLDPTLFIPKIIFFWKLFKYLALQNKIHTWITNTLNRKMVYKNIKKINDLHEQGHTIVYWTARGTKTGKMWYHLTTEQLKQWGCCYDELRLGKPAYDVLICDKTINLSNKKLL